MITKAAYDTLKAMQISSWQDELRNTIRDPNELLRQLGISPLTVALAKKSLQTFPLRVPVNFVARMQKNNIDDPLLQQVLPLSNEESNVAGFLQDPLDELNKQTTAGVLHKYHGRALLVTTGVCAIHCRYCFRRHFPYTEENASKQNWQDAVKYIAQDHTITEVILSGGDPLALHDEKLADLIMLLEEIPHLRRLRIHTRMPVIIPSRITDPLLSKLTETRLKTVIVVHVNHPNEIDNQAALALKKLSQAHLSVLNQSVLLKKVNDRMEPLLELSERLFDCDVLPYYLHMLDPVAGASHFNVTEQKALEIMQDLRAHLPGYLVPRLVREQPGAAYKIPVL